MLRMLKTILLCLLHVSLATSECQNSSYPQDRRVVSSSIAVMGVFEHTFETTADIWVHYIYKGGSKLASHLGIPESEMGNLRGKNIHLNVTVTGPCHQLDSIHSNQEYIVLLRSRGARIQLEPSAGGIIPINTLLEKRIFKLLGWEEWTEWSSCSAVCAGGEQTRYRRCRTGFCSAHTTELRYCNLFPCQGLINLLNVENQQYFKPARIAFRKIPERKYGWRMKAASYLLYPFKDAFGTQFPRREFSLFFNFKPYTNTTGVLLSLTNPKNKVEFLSVELTSIAGLKNLGVKLVHSTLNGSRVVAIPVEVLFNKWNYLAISIGDETTIKTYLNCKWVSTQILQEYSLQVHPTPDVALGYLFQGEIEQASLSENPEDVSEQCSVSNESAGSKTDPDYLDEEVVQLDRRSENPKVQLDSRSGDTKVQLDRRTEHPEDHTEGGSGGRPLEDDEVDEEGSGDFLVEWSTWSPCSTSCGPGTQIRWSRCTDSERMLECMDSGLEKRIIRSCSLRPVCPFSNFGSSHITSADIASFRGRFRNSSLQTDNSSFVRDNTGENQCGCKKNEKCNKEYNRCVCKTGWTGLNCSKSVCSPECVKGTCVQPDVCLCHSGYTGARCDTAFCHPECRNNGKCVEPFSCQCRPGFTGEYCQQSVCEKPCKNGGTCVSKDECACPHGFRGPDCGDFTCTVRCENGGVCTAPGVCACPPGFRGDTCHKRPCAHLVRTKMPVKEAYTRVLSPGTKEDAGITRTFYRTSYTTVIRCVVQQD